MLPRGHVWGASALRWPDLRWSTFPTHVVPGFQPNEVTGKSVAYHSIGPGASKEDKLRDAIQRARSGGRTGETVDVKDASCARIVAKHLSAADTSKNASLGPYLLTPSVRSVEVLLVESRALGRGYNDGYRDYHTISTILNARYADAWRLPFEVARPVRQPTDDTINGICRLFALEDKIVHLLAAGQTQTWLMYLDSDAIVREHLVDIRTLLPRLDPQTLPRGSTHLLLTKEEKYTDAVLPHPQPVNTGVMFFRVSHWSLSFIRSWSRAMLNEERCRRFLTAWPGEQGCLHVLLRGMLPHERQRVSVQPMAVLNGPWGQFIRHLFGEPRLYKEWGESWLSRSQPGGAPSIALIDELHRHGIWSKAQYYGEVERVKKRMRTFECTARHGRFHSGGQRGSRGTGGCSRLREPWRENRSGTISSGMPPASIELGRRVLASRSAHWGSSFNALSFLPQGQLRTLWGEGAWGVLPDAPGKLFADFGGGQHELRFESWPSFVSTRCHDGNIIRGSMSTALVSGRMAKSMGGNAR